MREAARLQAAIDILDDVILAAETGGAAADTVVRRYFATRRYAGSRDRAAVRDLVFRAIRFTADLPESGRALMLGVAADQAPELLPLFDGSAHAPAPPAEDEPRTASSLVPAWLLPQFQERFGDRWREQAEALIRRAPLDLRVNALKTHDVDGIAAELHAAHIEGLPFGLRLADPVPLENHPLFQSGAVEIQDAASQACVRLAAARPGETVIDLCAGAGGKTLALAADMGGQGRLIASDIDRERLRAMAPRLERAGALAFVEPRLLNPGQEDQAFADLAGSADVVLVDAPCSGTGTWRRNPELRWRLTEARLQRLEQQQRRLLNIAAWLVRPGGRVIFAVCSVLSREGPAHVDAMAGARALDRLSLTPLDDGCDGFFAVSLDTGQ